MKVRATMQGYHGMRQYAPGDVFELVPVEGKKLVKEKTADGKDEKIAKLVPYTFSPEEQFSDVWMERLEDEEDAPEQKPKAQAPDAKPFGAKKQKLVGYSASVDDAAESPSTGNQKVI